MWALTLAALLSAAPQPSAPPPDWALISDAELSRRLETLRSAPLPERLLRVSEGFLNAAYVASPLGEGTGADPDPMIRFDAVDCLTFVEQSLAMALATDRAQLDELLVQLRYDEEPTYEGRNHLMEAQWLPNNLRKGFLQDVTRRYGGSDVVTAEKVLTARNWISTSSKALKLPPSRQVTGKFRWSMLPLAKVMAHARDIPSGTILVVVREEHPLKATRVTHLGFVVQKKKRTYLRHAARSYGRTVDEDLETFLTRNAKYGKWKVSGVSLYAVREPLREGALSGRTPARAPSSPD